MTVIMLAISGYLRPSQLLKYGYRIWLSKSMSETYFLPEYSFVSSSRPTGGGDGGLGIFIRASLIYFILEDLSRMCHYIECIFIKILQREKKIIIIDCIYRPSNTISNADINMFHSEFRNILKAIDFHKK